MSTAISSATVNTIVAEDFGEKFKKRKTKEFIAAMTKWGIDPTEKSMFLMTAVSNNVHLSRRNIGALKMLTPRSLNLFDVLNSDTLLPTPAAVDNLNRRYGVNSEEVYEDGKDEEEEERDEGSDS